MSKVIRWTDIDWSLPSPSDVVGRWFVHSSFDGTAIYFCDSFDPDIGFWMTRVVEPDGSESPKLTDEQMKDGWTKLIKGRTNVSTRAIGATFHRVYEDTGCHWDGWGRKGHVQ